MVDEFVYQFQSFCQYQAKLKQRTDQELAFLRQFDEVWNVVGVLNYLQALIEKSMILQILDKEKNANFTFTATDGYDYPPENIILIWYLILKPDEVESHDE